LIWGNIRFYFLGAGGKMKWLGYVFDFGGGGGSMKFKLFI
jgi:hypothetical protein